MTSSHRYRRVCIVRGERHNIYGPDGKQVGFIRKAKDYGWDWRLWGGEWMCEGNSLDSAFEEVVQAHGDLVRGREATG